MSVQVNVKNKITVNAVFKTTISVVIGTSSILGTVVFCHRHEWAFAAVSLTVSAAAWLRALTGMPLIFMLFAWCGGTEDPSDPEVILRDLPEQERGQFLRQYHEAVDAAHDPSGYRRLRQLLHAWRLTVIATSRAGYYEELEAVRSGTAQTTPAQEAIPDWQERLAAARIQTR